MKPLLLYVLLTLTITLEAAFITDDFPDHYFEATTINFTNDVNDTLQTDLSTSDVDWFKVSLEEGSGVIISGYSDAINSDTYFSRSTF